MAEKTKQNESAEVKHPHIAHNIAAIRVRGGIGFKGTVEDTLKMLNLYRINYCVVLKATPSVVGMIHKVKDFITWGEINEETLKLLKEKRQEKGKDHSGKEIIKPFFRLSPPRGGYGRKGVKFTFNLSGALGYRKEKINDLIRKMI